MRFSPQFGEHLHWTDFIRRLSWIKFKRWRPVSICCLLRWCFSAVSLCQRCGLVGKSPSAGWARPIGGRTRDGNGYPIPEYPTGFTQYKGGYGMNSSPVGMLMGTILYPSGRRVRVRVWTTHTRVPMGNLYPQQSCIKHNKLDPYRYIYSKNWSICLLLCY